MLSTILNSFKVADIRKKLTVRAHAFSKTAREKIEAAGGTAEVIE